METHRQDPVSAQASTPKRQPPSPLAHVTEHVARLGTEPLRGPALQAERHRIRVDADALIGMAGA